MSIASLASPGFFAPLQGLWQWFVSSPVPSELLASRPLRRVCPVPVQAAPKAQQTLMVQPCPSGKVAGRRPLRVLRVVESGQSAAHGGRMLISGCMADVCAELDRLAAGEVTLH